MNKLFPFSGILIAKKSLFRNPVPSGCGGGSVFFVSKEQFWRSCAAHYSQLSYNIDMCLTLGRKNRVNIVWTTKNWIHWLYYISNLATVELSHPTPYPTSLLYMTIFFFSQFKVTENSHRYLKEIEMREEAGTPAIVGAIRAGLVFQLKQVQDKY